MSTEIPAEHVPPIAKEIASTRMTWAALIWFGTALAAVGGATMDPDPEMGLGARVAGTAFWVIVLFSLGLRQQRFARRANEAVRRAADKSATFVLAGRELLAYDSGGVAQPRASVKLSQRQVTMLTALPKAELRS